MTQQIDDLFHYQGVEHALAGISEGELFNPHWLNLKPEGSWTACWRGYQAIYGIIEKQLVLSDLLINLITVSEGSRGRKVYSALQGPRINGICSKIPDDRKSKFRDIKDHFNNHYLSINYPLQYTGGLLIATSLIPELSVNMGFQEAWKYQTVFELFFIDGLLIETRDYSQKMFKIRQQFQPTAQDKRYSLTQQDIEKFVKKAFDRRYERLM
jgi:hypothetical protein